jgi:Nucleotide-sugar transporter
MRFARVRKGDMFIASTAVVAAEFIKLLFCLGVMLHEQGGNLKSLFHYLIEVST